MVSAAAAVEKRGLKEAGNNGLATVRVAVANVFCWSPYLDAECHARCGPYRVITATEPAVEFLEPVLHRCAQPIRHLRREGGRAGQ